MTDPRGVCARRAETLTPGIPYVQGWAAAKRGADALAGQLLALGLDSDFPTLRPDVNVLGEGLVNVGALRPEVVDLLARLLAAGLALEAARDGTGRSGVEPVLQQGS